VEGASDVAVVGCAPDGTTVVVGGVIETVLISCLKSVRI